MGGLEQQFMRAVQHLSLREQEELREVLQKAKEWHAGQMRDSGEPYVTHPIAVALYLAELGADKETLMTALLHDVIEDERTTMDVLKAEFGETVARLVDGVTKLSKLRYEGRRAERQVASLRKMLLTASDDLRVICIKLADRWHNIETIESLQADKRQRVALETLEIYVPFARLVGLWELKSRLEEVCFPIAFPEESKVWHVAIAEVRHAVEKERMDFIQRVNAETENDVEPQLHVMTDYEIFTKLQGNMQRLQDVHNIDSALLLTHDTRASPIDCYRLLGEVHLRYPVQIGSFRDYISNPQPNGYHALHTVIFLSRHHRLLLRIQTQEMYEYVTKRKLSGWLTQRDNDVYKALSSLHKTSFDRGRYLQDLQETVLKERINVFTTSGEIVTLPQGATGVDFAYAMNPDHLSYLMGVRVNGELYEATRVIGDGDTVELVLLEHGKSTQRTLWLEKVKSVEARGELQKSLRHAPKEKRQEEGRVLLELECRKRRFPTWWLFHLSSLQKQLAGTVGVASFDELLEKLGEGYLPVNTVVAAYKNMLTETPNWAIQLMKLFHMLPKSRMLNKQASIMGIEVYAEDRRGLIHDVTRCFAQRDINIAKFEVFAVPPRDALYKIRLEAGSFQEFSNLFDALFQVPSVRNVLRKR